MRKESIPKIPQTLCMYISSATGPHTHTETHTHTHTGGAELIDSKEIHLHFTLRFPAYLMRVNPCRPRGTETERCAERKRERDGAIGRVTRKEGRRGGKQITGRWPDEQCNVYSHDLRHTSIPRPRTPYHAVPMSHTQKKRKIKKKYEQS